MRSYEVHKRVLVILLCLTAITAAMLAGSCKTPTEEPTSQPSTPQVEPAPSPDSPTPAPEAETKDKEYVWYAGYGSNLCRERFFCYITGGQYKLGGSYAKGCDDKTIPTDKKTIELPYSLYFARESSGWDRGGVAFLSTDEEENPENWTLARAWKIRREQFEQVRQQEGASWYNHIIDLGMDEEGIPILTITSSVKYALNPPSANYLSTIVTGLIESYQIDTDALYKYLHSKEGIQGYFSEEELRDIIGQGLEAGI
jgi:hypothetical protein